MTDWMVDWPCKAQPAALEIEMAKYLEELGYDVQEAQEPRAQGCAGAAGAGGEE